MHTTIRADELAHHVAIDLGWTVAGSKNANFSFDSLRRFVVEEEPMRHESEIESRSRNDVNILNTVLWMGREKDNGTTIIASYVSAEHVSRCRTLQSNVNASRFVFFLFSFFCER